MNVHLHVMWKKLLQQWLVERVVVQSVIHAQLEERANTYMCKESKD